MLGEHSEGLPLPPPPWSRVTCSKPRHLTAVAVLTIHWVSSLHATNIFWAPNTSGKQTSASGWTASPPHRCANPTTRTSPAQGPSMVDPNAGPATCGKRGTTPDSADGPTCGQPLPSRRPSLPTPDPLPPRSPSRPGPAPPLSRLGPHGPAGAHSAPHSASGWVRVLAAATQPRKDPEEGCPAGGLKDPSGARAV